MIQALIFDFDGLIVDTETPDYQSWQDTYKTMGAFLPLELWTSFIGRGNDDITFDPYAYLEEQLGHPVDRPKVRQQRQARYAELAAGEPIRPGIVQMIEQAKEHNLRLGVASSGVCGRVKDHLAQVNLIQYFDVIRCADDVTNTKPDPEVYLSALSALEIAPEKAVAFEDSPNGARAAKGAGMFCIAIPNSITASSEFPEVDMRLNTISDVTIEQVMALGTHS